MKKIVAVFLLVSFFVFSPVVKAQGDPNGPNSVKISIKEVEEYTAAVENCETPSLECLVRYTTRFVAIEWVNEILGKDNKIVAQPGTGTQIPGVLPDSTVASSQPGLINGTFGIISQMYANPVANTQTYVADVMDSAGLAPKAYAQGLGFSSLNPILNLWKTFRNISYFFFILLFIIIGFMIMFRQKIGGQAAVTAQQAIPSILVSLVLVTFSYAIAGFMIDLMYLVMFMIIGIFGDAIIQSSALSASGAGSLIDMNILQLTGAMFKGVWDGGVSNNVSENLLSEILSVVSGSGAGTALGELTSIGGGIIISLVISIAVLIGAFRLFFELLKSYFSIIVSVVTAPMFLMVGAIPGKNVFWPWLKNIIGNLAAFPAVLLVLVLFVEFTQSSGGATGGGGFMPPYLLNNGSASIIGPLMGLAAILAMPEIVKKVKAAMGATEGGVFWELAGAAGKNVARGADYAENAIPLGMAPVTAGMQMRRTFNAAKNTGGQTTRQALRTAITGGEIAGQKYGGFRTGWKSGIDRGVGIRKVIDRVRGGRFLDPEDPTNLLSRIADNQERDKKDQTVEPIKEKTPSGG